MHLFLKKSNPDNNSLKIHFIFMTTAICCGCSCCQYLVGSLAFSPGIPQQGASAREGVLHPQLSLAQVLATEIAAVGILVATVRVRVNLSGATWIHCGPWERVTEREAERGGQRVRGLWDGHHKWFHNRCDIYLDDITTDKWHCRRINVLPPCVSMYHGTLTNTDFMESIIKR